MRQFLRQCFWIAILCLIWSCSHTTERASNVSEQMSLAPGITRGTPQVEVVETSYNFGEVKDDGDYVHDFKVKNTGDGVLEIKKVLPG